MLLCFDSDRAPRTYALTIFAAFFASFRDFVWSRYGIHDEDGGTDGG